MALSAGPLANFEMYSISVQIQLISFKHVTSKKKFVSPPPGIFVK